jgi:hypothetical protein
LLVVVEVGSDEAVPAFDVLVEVGKGALVEQGELVLYGLVVCFSNANGGRGRFNAENAEDSRRAQRGIVLAETLRRQGKRNHSGGSSS